MSDFQEKYNEAVERVLQMKLLDVSDSMRMQGDRKKIVEIAQFIDAKMDEYTKGTSIMASEVLGGAAAFLISGMAEFVAEGKAHIAQKTQENDTVQ
jgi:predicted butyrate kinase (DUF1464 family)